MNGESNEDWSCHEELKLGTTFDFKSMKVGNEEFENWLLHYLNPQIHFKFYNIEVDGKSVPILEIPRAYRHPVSFHQEEYIRVGSYKKKIKEFPDKGRELWRTLDETPFETLFAKEHITADEVLSVLDYPTYFNLLKMPLPNGHAAILDALLSDEIITTCEAGGYNITNLGAILIARNLDNFSKLRRKAVRIIRYKGTGRIDMDSYRVEVKSSLHLSLPDKDAELGPVPAIGGGRKPEPEMDQLSNIIKALNDQFGNIDWNDADKIRKVISEELPAKVSADTAYQNAMKNSDKQNARIEHDRALQRIMVEILSDHTELFRQFSDNSSFKKWLSDTIFGVTYKKTGTDG